MANPTPEITPEEAKEGGAVIVGTGRSDYPNQINNVLAFPGVFRGTLDAKAKTINEEMKIAAAKALAEKQEQQLSERAAKEAGKERKAEAARADQIQSPEDWAKEAARKDAEESGEAN